MVYSCNFKDISAIVLRNVFPKTNENKMKEKKKNQKNKLNNEEKGLPLVWWFN